jgi:plastocyanin
MRRSCGGTWIALGAILTALVAEPVVAEDRPLISVSRLGLSPDRIQVHVGEVVRWRAVEGVRIRLEFDPHPDAHEVIQRAGEIRAAFKRTGEHWYVASIVGDGHQHARGLVVVRGAEGPASFPPVCGPESSERICVEP